MYELKEQSVIVTGAGSGIGRAAALLFAGSGARVTVCDVDEEGGEKRSQYHPKSHDES